MYSLICIPVMYSSLMFTYLQQTTAVEYAVVDKSKKKVSQEEHKPIIEHDDASVENKVTQVSVLTLSIYFKLLYVCTL